MIKFGILLVFINNSSRHQVIEQCILFGVVHDDRFETLVQTTWCFSISLENKPN